jgi:hypothetical protein
MPDRPIDLGHVLDRHFPSLHRRIDITDGRIFLTPQQQYDSIIWIDPEAVHPTLRQLTDLWPETLAFIIEQEALHDRESRLRGNYPSFQQQILMLARAISTGNRTEVNQFLTDWDNTDS